MRLNLSLTFHINPVERCSVKWILEGEMKLLIAALLLISTPAFAWTTYMEEYEPDFSQARPCKDVDGRKFWVGKKAYYIQDWLFATPDSGLLDDDAVAVIPFADNKPVKGKDTLAKYCK
jgi:hypothetical protein